MKKYLLLLGFSSIATFTFAQFDDTKYVLGGTVNYGAYETISNSAFSAGSNFGIAPSIAKVISPSSLLGVQLGFNHNKSESPNDVLTNTSYSLRAYYQPFYPISEKIFFNWRALGGISGNQFTSEENKYNSLGLNLGVVPGLTWQVMDKLLLSASIGGASFNKSLFDSSSLNAWTFNISFNQPSFSFNYLLK